MKPLKRVLGSLRKADEDYGLIENDDHIAVGISGGKDSSLLLYCLYLYQRFSRKHYQITAVYVDLGFGQENMDSLVEFFRKYGIEIRTVTSQIHDILKLYPKSDGSLECSLCSKLRKGALINAARELGCNKIALGHHSDDAVETLFINMIHGAKVATFQPNTYLDRSGIIMIRPFIYAFESDIAGACRQLEMPASGNLCPNSGHTERQAVKELLKKVYEDYPQAKNNFQLMLRNQLQFDLLKPKTRD